MSQKIKIVDTFILYNELEMLYYRLSLLGPLVDYFVLVESNRTFSYNPKPLYYNDYKHLLPYTNKIIHVVLDDLPHSNNCWANEYFQRNSIDSGIKQLELTDSDIIIVSDVDEIPNPIILKEIKNGTTVIEDVYRLLQDMYYYNLTCKLHTIWSLSKIMNYKSYHAIIHHEPQKCRYVDSKEIPNGGWHLSYFGDVNFIQNKLKNFSHQEYNNDTFNNESHIKNVIEQSIDLFNRQGIQIIKINISDNTNLPPEFFQIMQQFKQLNINN